MSVKTVMLWPLWSPRRLGLTAAAFVAMLGILGGCAGAGHSGKPSRLAVTTPGPAGQPTPSPVDHSPEVSKATAFVTVWLSHTPAAVWLPSVEALSTPALGAGFSTTNTADVPGTKVTGPGVWSPSGVIVPTDAGSVIVTLNPSGKVSDIEPTSAPSAAMGR
jgi:hypothetical protein